MLPNANGILNDIEITTAVHEFGMIEKFLPNQVKLYTDQDNDALSFGIISAGLSSYGYDVRLAKEAKLFTNLNAGVIDPKRPDRRLLAEAEIFTEDNGEAYFLIPPHGYALGRTVERFNMPRDIAAVCYGKSTYARAGAVVNVTPIEPGFQGEVVIEIANTTPLPLKIYVNEGIAQFVFFRGRPCQTSYADRSGKYQNQKGIQLGFVQE